MWLPLVIRAFAERKCFAKVKLLILSVDVVTLVAKLSLAGGHLVLLLEAGRAKGWSLQ